MKIPKTVNILSDIYTVKVEPDIFPNDNGRMLSGEISYANKTIRIAKAENSTMIKTLMHEIIHGICTELSLYDNDIHDETFVDRLAVGLIDTLQRNNLLKGEK